VGVEGSLGSSAPPVARFRGTVASSTLVSTLVAIGLLLVGFLVRLYLTRKIPAPWIMGDELLYSDLARNVADTGHLALRGLALSVRTYGIYPLVVAPAWLADSTTTAYGLAKTINALLMTLAAVPIYLWARRVVRPELALCVLGLVLLLPAMSYSGTLMTENVAFPAVCLALFMIALALERPTLGRQLFALVAIFLAVACRLQNVVFFAILPLALAVKVFLDWRASERRFDLKRELRSYLPTFVALAALVLMYAAYQVVRGRPLSGGLGGYEVVADADYSLRAVGRWVVFHAGELSFAVALIPVSALIIMFGLACTRRFATTSAERAFLAVAAASLLFIVQAGAFASQFIQRIEERNMIYVEPVLLLAFVLWLERGAPRPQRLTLVAFLVPVALLTSIPFERLFNVSIFSDTTGLLPLLRVSALVSGGTDGMRVLLVLGALAVMVFAALASTRVLVVGGLIGVALFLGVSTKMVVGSQRSQAVAARLATGTSDVDWVDDRVPKGETAALLFNSDLAADGHPAWQTEFWNRDVQRVIYLGARDFGFPGFEASVSAAGLLASASGTATHPPAVDYVVAPLGADLAGERVATEGRFALWRVSKPLRLATRSEGFTGDGWTGSDATFTRYRPGAQLVFVDLSRPKLPVAPGLVRVELVSRGSVVETRRWVARSDSSRSFRFRAPAAPFSVQIHVAPTFSPADVGLADTRQLGVLASVRALPR
jgi:hypothetical protein